VPIAKNPVSNAGTTRSRYNRGMSDKPKKPSSWHWAWAAPGLLLALYVGGYFALVSHPLGPSVANVRIYPSRHLMALYVPLAWIDAHSSRRQVVLTTDGDEGGRFIINP
jgi:hypothetical protein